MKSFHNEISDLRKNVWITAGSRYNASRRLKLRHRWSFVTIAWLSAVGVAVPILHASSFLSIYSSHLPLYSSLLALLVLVLGLIESNASFEIDSRQLFENAEKLTGFRTRVEVILSDEDVSEQKVLELLAEYELIKNSCAINHEPIDYRYFVAMHRADEVLFNNEGSPRQTIIESFFVKIKYALASRGWMLLVWSISIFGFIYIM
ncbi:SLATT domain-containing protein [Oleiagrimonas sp. MCCC 1A03011]|uniref:SLATT domain-containing protein n=1 Tax=Oleiagrimonas sp. MCCC 1A03011 TaxID=1926883 RepID=UPI000DD931BA|nr:SLATT domain-containing protein [Oleiagrimonas sp. MCCC 1A03011]